MWCPHPLVTSEGTLQVIKIRGIPTTSSFGLSYAKREARERRGKEKAFLKKYAST